LRISALDWQHFVILLYNFSSAQTRNYNLERVTVLVTLLPHRGQSALHQLWPLWGTSTWEDEGALWSRHRTVWSIFTHYNNFITDLILLQFISHTITNFVLPYLALAPQALS